jgi:hypothetical protein
LKESRLLRQGRLAGVHHRIGARMHARASPENASGIRRYPHGTSRWPRSTDRSKVAEPRLL